MRISAPAPDGVTLTRDAHGVPHIRAADLVSHLLVTERVDTVMHFAAQSHVDNSFLNSVTFTEHNVLGTHYLLEACRVYGGIRKFVYVSTDEVYGETMNPKMADAGVTEETVLAPTNPYDAAKAGGEMQVKAYMDSYKLPCLMTRGNNVYGPGQFPEKVIPKFIMLANEGKSLPLHGGGHSALSWAAFARDICSRCAVRAVAFDQRGHGTTAVADEQGGLHFLAQRLLCRTTWAIGMPFSALACVSLSIAPLHRLVPGHAD